MATLADEVQAQAASELKGPYEAIGEAVADSALEELKRFDNIFYRAFSGIYIFIKRARYLGVAS